jgi:hypothetical protein
MWPSLTEGSPQMNSLEAFQILQSHDPSVEYYAYDAPIYVVTVRSRRTR